jgi:hypothetical protein
MQAPQGPAPPDEQRLLDRHAPILRYDPQDLYRAISAESAVANPGNVLLDADGETIARAGSGGSASLSLRLLGDYERRRRVRDERLAFAPGYATDVRRMQAAEHPFARRIYGRVCPSEAGKAWLQYWFFYYYNPKNLRGLGKHEGDWEMVQVHLDPSGAPDRVIYAQHEFGEARPWQEIESRDLRPIVYVAELSHASYFRRGSFPYAIGRPSLPFGIDHALGGRTEGQPDGPEEIPTVEVFPEQGWPLWPGRWGTGERTVFGRIGDGPGSPGNQEPKWSDPEAFHRRQGRLSPVLRRLAGQVGRFIGRGSFPDPPVLEACEWDGDELRISYRIEAHGLHRTKYVVLTVNEADGQQLVLVSRLVRKVPASDKAVFSLPEVIGPLRVWASAFNGPRQRSDPTSIEVPPQGFRASQ